MHRNIKIKKFIMDEQNPQAQISDQERVKFLTTTDKILIQILEIETDNPNDLILVISTEANGGKMENPIYLFSYREKMLFQNNRYILKLDYTINTSGTHFNLDVVSDNKKPFKITAYYSTY